MICPSAIFCYLWYGVDIPCFQKGIQWRHTNNGISALRPERSLVLKGAGIINQ